MTKKYSTISDLATYHSVRMNGKKMGGVKSLKIETGLDGADFVTRVTLTFAIKAGSLKADGEVIEFATINGLP